MKKLLLFVSIIAMTFTATAQHTTPRVGSGVNYDPRQASQIYVNSTDAAGADSIAIAPNAYVYTYTITLVDSFTLKQPTVTNCFLGDEIRLILKAASGTPKLKFTGSNWVTAGTATLSSGLRGEIDLIFDGGKYIEKSRTIQ